MASFRVTILPSAGRELMQVPFPIRRQINQRIMSLMTKPRPPLSRIVNGDILLVECSGWRLVYEVDDAATVVTVLAILPPIA